WIIRFIRSDWLIWIYWCIRFSWFTRPYRICWLFILLVANFYQHIPGINIWCYGLHLFLTWCVPVNLFWYKFSPCSIPINNLPFSFTNNFTVYWVLSSVLNKCYCLSNRLYGSIRHRNLNQPVNSLSISINLVGQVVNVVELILCCTINFHQFNLFNIWNMAFNCWHNKFCKLPS